MSTLVRLGLFMLTLFFTEYVFIKLLGFLEDARVC